MIYHILYVIYLILFIQYNLLNIIYKILHISYYFIYYISYIIFKIYHILYIKYYILYIKYHILYIISYICIILYISERHHNLDLCAQHTLHSTVGHLSRPRHNALGQGSHRQWRRLGLSRGCPKMEDGGSPKKKAKWDISQYFYTKICICVSLYYIVLNIELYIYRYRYRYIQYIYTWKSPCTIFCRLRFLFGPHMILSNRAMASCLIWWPCSIDVHSAQSVYIYKCILMYIPRVLTYIYVYKYLRIYRVYIYT